jgi:hypothetical protein
LYCLKDGDTGSLKWNVTFACLNNEVFSYNIIIIRDITQNHNLYRKKQKQNKTTTKQNKKNRGKNNKKGHTNETISH